MGSVPRQMPGLFGGRWSGGGVLGLGAFGVAAFGEGPAEESCCDGGGGGGEEVEEGRLQEVGSVAGGGAEGLGLDKGGKCQAMELEEVGLGHESAGGMDEGDADEEKHGEECEEECGGEREPEAAGGVRGGLRGGGWVGLGFHGVVHLLC